jgi:O-acetyl-ADP-ribose deacetylase (regulator of RNase III)
MKQARGNIWDLADTTGSDVLVITTNGFVKANGDCVMGRGIAREARDRIPGIAQKLGTLIRRHGNRAMRVYHAPGYWVVSMPTKHVWVDKSDPALIQASARQLVEMADKFGWQSVVMPRPGCGNGGLNWADIEPMLADILDDRFTVCTH